MVAVSDASATVFHALNDAEFEFNGGLVLGIMAKEFVLPLLFMFDLVD